MNDNKKADPVILIVDDEESILKALSRILRHEELQILTARSGTEALQITRNSHVDMMICDIRMPEMTGNHLLSIISSEKPEIIRTVLTGYTEVNSIIESINKGHIARFFIKPWNNDELVKDIKDLLKKNDVI